MHSGLQSRFGAILILLTTLCLATPCCRLSAEQATVLSVSDGDTVVLQIARNRERVRLIGIDTPESHSNPRAKKQAARNHQDVLSIIEQGKAAALYTKNLLPRGTSVRIEHDIEKRDHYGRVLAYLWLPSGEMINEKILASGYAYPLTIAPNVKYQERFLKAFHEARKAKRGLWAR
jgi:micrococcal nuclease